MTNTTPLNPEELTAAAMALGALQRQQVAGGDAALWVDRYGERLIATVLRSQRDLGRYRRSHRALQNVGTAGAKFLKVSSDLVTQHAGLLPKRFAEAFRAAGRAGSSVVLGQLAVASAALEHDDREAIDAAARKEALSYLGKNAANTSTDELNLEVPDTVH
jgi:hypothetical protein